MLFCPKLFPVLLAAGFLCLQPYRSTAVLCVGTDGHVALEQGASDQPPSCESAHAQDGAAPTSHSVEDATSQKGVSHCGTCNDSAIALDTLCSPGQAPVSAPASARQPANLLAATAETAGLQGMHRRGTALRRDSAACRSVVLRC